jgi:tetratricopeptide (TPR) repeat protein
LQDSGLFILLGDTALSGSGDERPNAMQERVDLYEKAINLSPRQASFYERLTDALFSIEKPREEDEKFLTIGLRLFPGNDWLRVGTAVVDSKLGRQEAAMTTLDSVLRPQSTLDPSQRRYAQDLRRRWLLDAMQSELDTAQQKKDFAGARAVIARYRERVGDDSDTASYLTELENSMRLNEVLAKYNAALHAQNKAQIRELGNQILALPDLPANIRTSVQKQLGRSP